MIRRPHKTHNLEIEGQTFRGTTEKIIPALEGAGYQAIRENANPHPFFQYAQGLKNG